MSKPTTQLIPDSNFPPAVGQAKIEQEQQDDDEEIDYEREQFDESPRQKVGSQGVIKEKEADQSLEK